jgi:hypothetical protein
MHALESLQNIYAPERRYASGNLPVLPKYSSNFLVHSSIPDSGYASAEEDEEDLTKETIAYLPQAVASDARLEPLDLLRADPFERAFVIKWLTGFIARSDPWLATSLDQNDANQRAEVVDTATAILSAFSREDDADVPLTRSFSFPTLAASK